MWSSAQVLPQVPIGVSSLSAASPLLSVPHPAVPSSSLPASSLRVSQGSLPWLFSLALVFLDVACLFCSWLGLSSAGFSVSLLPAVLCLVLHYCLLPLFALLLLAPLRVSKALPLRCLGLLELFGSMQFAPSRSRVFSGLVSSSFCAAPVASAVGLSVFPSASASSFIAFVGSTPMPGCAQTYAPLSGTSTTPSVLLSVSG